MDRSDHSHAWRPLLLVLAGALASAPIPVAAKKAVVVLGFSGPRGGQASRIVARALGRRFKIVSRGAFRRAARTHTVKVHRSRGRSVAARALRVTAVITGTITRADGHWLLGIGVYSGHNGRVVGATTFPLRGSRLDNTTAHRVVRGIIRAISRARAGPPLTQDTPRIARRRLSPQTSAVPAYRQQAQGSVDELELTDRTTPVFNNNDGMGFETPEPDGSGSLRRRRARIAEQFRLSKRPKKKRARWRKLLDASVGVMVLSRSFAFHGPINPVNLDEHSYYRSGAVPALFLEAEVYPLARLRSSGPLSNLGIVGRYYRALGLKSEFEATAGQKVRTTLHDFEVGLRYRWNILRRISSPVVSAGLEIGRLGFVIWDEDNTIPLPNIGLLYLKLALVGIEVPFYAHQGFSIGLTGSFDYLIVFSAGAIENPDITGYGRSSTSGLDAGFGLFGSLQGFSLKVRGFYRRVKFDFDNSCLISGCRAAEEALDVYTGATVTVGYGF